MKNERMKNEECSASSALLCDLCGNFFKRKVRKEVAKDAKGKRQKSDRDD